MPRLTQPLIDWRGDRWSPVIGRAIVRRLDARRARLATLLNIDLNDREWRNEPADYPDDQSISPTEQYVRWRHRPPAKGGEVLRIDLALEDLSSALRLCWSLLRDVNRAGSQAQVYRTLEAIEARPESFANIEAFYKVDPEARGWIEDHYPGGWLALDSGAFEADKLAAAAAAARSALGVPRRGRPAGTKDRASERLARQFAEIYAQYAEVEPTRRKPWRRGTFEYGPYKAFVEEVIGVIPVRLRRTAKGGVKHVDHLVRLGVEHVKPPKKKT